jgi:decaprenyl-phosphate phosphoribosyltransferase
MSLLSEHIAPRTSRAVPMPALLELLRPRHWIKNLFVGAPLFFTPAALSWQSLHQVAAGIATFCALASAVYILNDHVDRESDRLHPLKCRRPLASGRVGTVAAFAMLGLLVVYGLGLAASLSRDFACIAAGYLVINLGYSLGLKRVSIVDVMLIALGFVLRVEAGATLIHVEASAWILICTGLLALFLALGKRRDDLVRALGSDHRRSLDGYTKPFLDMAVSIVLGALLVAYLIYCTDADAMARLGTDKLFYTAPFVVAGILRYLQIMIVEQCSGSPTSLVTTDRFLIITILGWVATFAALIYL